MVAALALSGASPTDFCSHTISLTGQRQNGGHNQGDTRDVGWVYAGRQSGLLIRCVPFSVWGARRPAHGSPLFNRRGAGDGLGLHGLRPAWRAEEMEAMRSQLPARSPGGSTPTREPLPPAEASSWKGRPHGCPGSSARVTESRVTLRGHIHPFVGHRGAEKLRRPS